MKRPILSVDQPAPPVPAPALAGAVLERSPRLSVAQAGTIDSRRLKSQLKDRIPEGARGLGASRSSAGRRGDSRGRRRLLPEGGISPRRAAARSGAPRGHPRGRGVGRVEEPGRRARVGAERQRDGGKDRDGAIRWREPLPVSLDRVRREPPRGPLSGFGDPTSIDRPRKGSRMLAAARSSGRSCSPPRERHQSS